jgi:hypothetical protein
MLSDRFSASNFSSSDTVSEGSISFRSSQYRRKPAVVWQSASTAQSDQAASSTRAAILITALKVLFDALRMPHDASEVSETPSVEGEVIFCLLADDNLITDLSIESFRLLDPPSTDENYVEAEIGVTVQAVTPMQGTSSLLFP